MAEILPFQKRYESMSEAAVDLETANHLLSQEKEVLVASLMNCQKALDITKDTMRNALTEQNLMKDSFAAEIAELKSKIKELTHGRND